MNLFTRISQKIAWFLLGILCLTSFAMMLWASGTDSAIMDELAHIPAGYGYVHNLDYRLNPEHPPLVKALALLPIFFLQPYFPTQSNAWQNEVNAEWSMGTQFLYENGNNANEIIQNARVVPILLTILLIVLVYFFARELMGPLWALLPSFLLGLDPNVLAQGHYVTTDIGAALGITFALYFFIRFVESPTTRHLWYAGLSFGIAQLIKFSAPLLIPLYIFLFLVLWIRDLILDQGSHNTLKKRLALAWRYFRNLVIIFAIGYILVVYPVYFLFTLHYPIAKQVSDTIYILGSFANGPTPAGQLCHGMRCLADLDISMAHNSVLRPFAQYFLGILMVLQRTDGGNTIYFLGHVVGSGGWIYFPILYLLKEPIPLLIIVFVALFLVLSRIVRTQNESFKKRSLDYIRLNFAEFSMASFIILYWGYSIESKLNIGLRHIMPTLPFISILAAGVWKKWLTRIDLSRNVQAGMRAMARGTSFIGIIARSFLSSILKIIFLCVLLVWFCCETFVAAPYFLSYFNEFGGGVWNGYHYVTDSNYDWGQDLLRLQTFVDQHPEIHKIAVDYFGGGNPKYYLGHTETGWTSSKGNPANQGIEWLAVSVNTLELATQPLADGQSRNASDTYWWLTELRPPAPGMGNVPPPDFRAGTSIFIYHL